MSQEQFQGTRTGTPAVAGLQQDPGILAWLFSTDHRRIALMQLVGLAVAGFIGGALAWVMHLEKSTPALDRLSPEAFAASFTMHGAVMLFLLLVPAIPGTLGTFILPFQLGSRSLAFPRLHLLSLQSWTLGGLSLFLSLWLGGAQTGWTLSLPLSLQLSSADALLAVGIAAISLSAILRAIVLITSIHTLRGKGHTWSRTSPFAWSLYAHSVVMLIAAPVLLLTILLLIFESRVGLGLFDPVLGGDPLLFQNFFWFGAQAFAYAAVVPAIGVITQVFLELGTPDTKPPRSLLGGIVGVAGVALVSWGIRTPTSGHGIASVTFFSLIALLSMVPSAHVIGSWLALLKNDVRGEAPLWFALGAMLLFIVGGLATLPLAALSTAVHLHGTAFAVGQSHLLFLSVALAALAGLHLWWPLISGTAYSQSSAKFSATLMTCGALLSFVPQLILGSQGLPRRMVSYPAEFQGLQIASSLGAALMLLGATTVLVYLANPMIQALRQRTPSWRRVKLG